MNTQILRQTILNTALFSVLALGLFTTCSKTETVMSVPAVSTKTPTTITATSAVTGGFVSSSGGSSITERGVCYSTNQNPTVSDYTVTEGTGTGNYLCTINGLNPSTSYYVRAYALNSSGVGYGNQVIFITTSSEGLPEVATAAATNITGTTAVSGGEITSQGAGEVIARGVCWSSLHDPSLSDAHTVDGTGIGVFTSILTGLSVNTVYYLRAYATNSVGTSYGSELSFVTTGSGGNLPSLTTAVVTDIGLNTAISGGTITAEGGSQIQARGVCWSTSPSPTIANSYSIDGTGTGTFVSNLTGLTPATLYYVRAYATNGAGTGYGDTKIFTTVDPSTACPPTVIYEGKTYHTVAINSQCWMKENMDVGVRIDGSQNQDGSNGTIEKYCYADLDVNCEIYGGLYQWDEMMQGAGSPGARGICPEGWHVSTDEEWMSMINLLGGDSIAGGRLKIEGTAYWLTPNFGATNESGFSALPGGYRDSFFKTFKNLTINGTFWTATDNGATVAWYQTMHYGGTTVGRYSGEKTAGSSVRCVKD